MAVVFLPAGSVNAQDETVVYGEENIARDYCSSYKIGITCKEPCNSVVYLSKLIFNQIELVDSAVIKNGKAVLSKSVTPKEKNDVDKLIPKGFYVVSFGDYVYARPFIIVINQQTSFDIVVENGIAFDHDYDAVSLDAYLKGWQDRRFVGSKENQMLMTLNLTECSAKDAFDAVNKAVDLASEMPQTWLSQYYSLQQLVFASVQPYREEAAIPFSEVDGVTFQDVITSSVDFADGRLCHSNSMYYMLVEEFLTSDARKSVDEIITEVDTILLRAAKGGRYQCGMYAKWLYDIFDKTGDPYYEPVMLHIYDTYDRGWIPEDRERRIKRQMDRIRKLAPGAQIPELTAYDINGKQHSTNEIQTKYTVLWFWDPDCDHCQEMTPILHDLYQKQADELDFEVFAVEVNDDYDRWKAFSEKHGLSDWINLSTSMGETNVDYIEYFDIVTTPVILLIDNENNHTIIARQVTLEEIVREMRR